MQPNESFAQYEQRALWENDSVYYLLSLLQSNSKSWSLNMHINKCMPVRCCISCSYFHLHFEIWTKRTLRIPTIHRPLPILFKPELVEILPTKQTHAAANKITAWCSIIQSLGWSNLIYLYIHFLWVAAITHPSGLTINYEGFTPWGIPIARKLHPFKTKQYSWQQIQFCFPLNYKTKQKIGFSPCHLASERN